MIGKNIDFTIQKRNLAKNELQEDFYKLLNNALYGKRTGNFRNRVR